MKKILRFLTQRVVLTALLILIQALLLFGIIWKLNNYFIYFYAFSVLLSLLLTLRIINNKSNPAFKIAWLIPILLFPVLGGLVYLVFGSDRTGKYIRNKMGRIEKEMQDGISKANERSGIEKMPPDVVNQSHYISNSAHCPPYKNTTVEYLPMGEVKFERMVQELKKAKRYIFMEYFIIQEGTMWNTILDVLEEKAKEGVDVRVIYDDMGCILTLPKFPFFTWTKSHRLPKAAPRQKISSSTFSIFLAVPKASMGMDDAAAATAIPSPRYARNFPAR